MLDDNLCTVVEDKKMIIVEASMIEHLKIKGWTSSNNIYHMLRIYSAKSKKNYTFIHSGSDVVKNSEGEIGAWIYKSESSNGSAVSGWELHILNT